MTKNVILLYFLIICGCFEVFCIMGKLSIAIQWLFIAAVLTITNLRSFCFLHVLIYEALDLLLKCKFKTCINNGKERKKEGVRDAERQRV